MAQTRTKKYAYFVGIDVSRNSLDYAVIQNDRLLFHEQSLNSPDAITGFIGKLHQLPKFTIGRSVFCMEHTGIYCNHLLRVLKSAKANIVVLEA